MYRQIQCHHVSLQHNKACIANRNTAPWCVTVQPKTLDLQLVSRVDNWKNMKNANGKHVNG